MHHVFQKSIATFIAAITTKTVTKTTRTISTETTRVGPAVEK